MTAVTTLCFAGALLVAMAAAQYTIGDSYIMNGTVLIVQEGVAFSGAVHQDSQQGKVKTHFFTPNGYYTRFIVVDRATGNGMLYMTYDINNTTICYGVNAGTIPLPFPTTNPGFSTYVKRGMYNGVAMDVYEASVGRYARILYTDAAASGPAGAGIRTVETNQEAMNQVIDSVTFNNTLSQADVFNLPSACTGSAVRWMSGPSKAKSLLPQFLIRDGDMRQSTKTYAPLSMDLPAELKFNVEDPRNSAAEFHLHIQELQQHYGQEKLQVYEPRSSTLRSLAAAIDNRKYATGIRDQGQCGGCWAFSSAAITETVYNYKNNIVNPIGSSGNWVSVQNIIDCATGDLNGTAMFPSKGCFGGWPLVGLMHIVQHGVVPEGAYPYDAANGLWCRQGAVGVPSQFLLSAASYIPYTTSTAGNIPLLMAAIQEHGAVIAIINAEPILFYSGGYVFSGTCQPSLGHAVTMVGYGTDSDGMDYWIVKNSFGAAWGEGGFFRIQRGQNVCGIEQMGFVAVAA